VYALWPGNNQFYAAVVEGDPSQQQGSRDLGVQGVHLNPLALFTASFYRGLRAS
jgi:hypothetical protein